MKILRFIESYWKRKGFINKILKGAIIMSFISVKNLNFKYPNGTENVLNDVSLEVKKGEKVAIIGQNGAGKTTMVKMLNGLLKPVSGDVVVDDWNTKKYTVAKMSRKVGYVFQNPMDQIFHNNVYDEIAFGAKKLKGKSVQFTVFLEKICYNCRSNCNGFRRYCNG